MYYDLSLAPEEFWDHVRADGGDVRVFGQDGSPLPRQLVDFDRDSHSGSLFFATRGESSFVVAYGNQQMLEPDVNSSIGSASVWETEARQILHGDSYEDSTVNGNDVVPSAGCSIDPDGKLTSAIKTTLATDILKTDHNATLEVSDLTIMAMVKQQVWNDGTTASSYARKGYYDAPYFNGLQFATHPSGDLCGSIQTGDQPYSDHGLIILEKWAHVAITIASDGTVVLYVDGVPRTPRVGVKSSNGPAAIPTSEPLCWCNREWDLYQPMRGLLCEARCYGRILSGEEIASHFAQQNSPSTFWTVGDEHAI